MLSIKNTSFIAQSGTRFDTWYCTTLAIIPQGKFILLTSPVPRYIWREEAMEMEQGDTMTRLAVCAVVAIGAVYAAETLFDGKHFPLWDKYGPWVKENKLQAAAILAAALYAASLALWPQLPEKKDDDGFTPCQ